MDKNILQKEYDYFLSNKKELLKKYNNRYILIQNQTILADFKEIEEAVEFIRKNDLELGTFILELCDEKSFRPKTFHTRARFN